MSAVFLTFCPLFFILLFLRQGLLVNLELIHLFRLSNIKLQEFSYPSIHVSITRSMPSCPAFYMSAGNLNLGFHACMASP